MGKLDGKVALVTGASRGVGRGIAIGLAEAGASVYITGRATSEADHPEALSGTVESTARQIAALSGNLNNGQLQTFAHSSELVLR